VAEKEKGEKIVYVGTHGPDEAERAIIPFMLANGAMVMDVEAVVILTGPGVMLALRGVADHVLVGGLTPLKKLIEEFLAQGGRLLLCTPCVQLRQLDKSELIGEAKLIAAAVFAEEVLSANAVLTF
jgi:predicted peroxiredoxin